jgi:large repetitive protein
MSFITGTTIVSWTPTAAQLGDNNTVNIKVSDGHESLTQTFTIDVTEQQDDHPPTITSTPPQYAIVGDVYTYPLTATDPDNDMLSWKLDSGPEGMVLDPVTNSLVWTPTADQANTTPSVTVEVDDGHGGGAEQIFQIDVLAADLPPMISSEPPTSAGTGVTYAYQVVATSPDNFYPLRYSVTTSPNNTNITMNSSTGLLQWASPTTGTESITITVSDPAGLSASQTYNLTTSSTPPGKPPVISSTPPLYAGVSSAYSYPVVAADPQNSTLNYSISESPVVSGSDLAINHTTGVVSWTPITGEIGTETLTITVTDTLGLQAVQTFNVNVVNSQPPTITGTPPSTLTAGQTFVYQVQASDPAGDTLTYALIGQPNGMVIDSSGRITWPTTAANIGDYTYQVVVTNPAGLSKTSPSYPLDVIADTTKPTVQVQISSNPADQNSLVYFDVIASDNVGVTSINLTVGGAPVTLGANGQGVYIASTLGQLAVVAKASDAAGNVGEADATLSVIDPTDTSAPTVTIASPTNGATITQPTEVTGVVNDSHILSWTLAEAPLNGGSFTTIASGTSTVNGNLGLFDPTTLADGAYTIELTAWNAGGHVSSTSITVNVTGYLKLGNLSLSFTDLSIPVAGIPITITRTYNSLNANTVGDFGYGWTLSESDYQLNVNTQGNGLGSINDYVPLEGGNRVVVTLPDGTEEGFTFEPQPVYNSGEFSLVVEYYAPYFQPDPGVTDTLTVMPLDLNQIAGTNEYYGGDYGDDYNPAESEFGGVYTLTNESGIGTTFDATSGQVLSESDRHGNTLNFDSSGIYSNTGLQVTFTRDSQGRITSITDPTGTHSIVYRYDAAGDLVSVTDRDDNVTTMAYNAALPHFLTQITDAMGNSVLNMQYSASGRITSITNATGQSDSLSYNLGNLSETATAPGNTNPTTNTYNSEGLLTQSVDADNNVTDYAYSSNNYLTSKTQVVGDKNLLTTYVNNSYGQPTQETDPAGNTTYYSYDQYGDPTSETDSYGDTTSFDYYYNPNAPGRAARPHGRRPALHDRPGRGHDGFQVRRRRRCSEYDKRCGHA